MTAAETVILVGDRFQGFASQARVHTVSQLVQELQHGKEARALVVRTAQGVNDFDLSEVREALHAYENELGRARGSEIKVSDLQLATKGQCHKRKASNVLIANLQTIDDRSVGAQLRIDADNELLLDHQTGQHVQGMVSIEAARQMFIASSTVLGHCRGIEGAYFVINSMTTEFKSFLFPLPADLSFQIVRETECANGARRFNVEISLTQGAVVVSVTSVDYSIYPSVIIHELEQRKAECALSQAYHNA